MSILPSTQHGLAPYILLKNNASVGSFRYVNGP